MSMNLLKFYLYKHLRRLKISLKLTLPLKKPRFYSVISVNSSLLSTQKLLINLWICHQYLSYSIFSSFSNRKTLFATSQFTNLFITSYHLKSKREICGIASLDCLCKFISVEDMMKTQIWKSFILTSLTVSILLLKYCKLFNFSSAHKLLSESN